MQSVVVAHSQPEKEEDVAFPIYWYTQSKISIFLLFFNELELDFDLEWLCKFLLLRHMLHLVLYYIWF